MSENLEARYQELAQKYNKDLLKLALDSIKYGLENKKPIAVNANDFPADLQAKGACFVTLEKNKDLRGCIGSIIAYRSLIEDVAENAFASAFRDNRFSPLKEQELKDISVSISIITPFEEMSFSDEDDLLSQLRPNIDGLIIEDMGRRAVFLPIVWEHFDNKQDFLNHLKMKAGLPANHFSKSFKASRFLSVSVK